jgi:hypothetical protein
MKLLGRQSGLHNDLMPRSAKLVQTAFSEFFRDQDFCHSSILAVSPVDSDMV